MGAYLQITSQRIDMDWLGQFSDSAMAVAWAARTYTRHDRSHPCDRVALYQAGLNFHLIADLLGSPYNANDLRSLAEALKVSVNAAGHVLAGWLAADCAPQVDDLIRAARLADGARPTPAAQAIQAIASAAGVKTSMSRTEIGLILVAAGTPTTATALIRRGVRTLDDIETDRRHRGQGRAR